MQVGQRRIDRFRRDHERAFRRRFDMLDDVPLEYSWGGRLCLSRNSVPAFGEWSRGCTRPVVRMAWHRQRNISRHWRGRTGCVAIHPLFRICCPMMHRKAPPTPVARYGPVSSLANSELALKFSGRHPASGCDRGSVTRQAGTGTRQPGFLRGRRIGAVCQTAQCIYTAGELVTKAGMCRIRYCVGGRTTAQAAGCRANRRWCRRIHSAGHIQTVKPDILILKAGHKWQHQQWHADCTKIDHAIRVIRQGNHPVTDGRASQQRAAGIIVMMRMAAVGTS